MTKVVSLQGSRGGRAAELANPADQVTTLKKGLVDLERAAQTALQAVRLEFGGVEVVARPERGREMNREFNATLAFRGRAGAAFRAISNASSLHVFFMLTSRTAALSSPSSSRTAARAVRSSSRLVGRSPLEDGRLVNGIHRLRRPAFPTSLKRSYRYHGTENGAVPR